MSDCFRSNVPVTPRGIWRQRYLPWSVEVLGVDRTLFSTDWLHTLAVLLLIVGAVSALAIIIEEMRHPQRTTSFSRQICCGRERTSLVQKVDLHRTKHRVSLI